MSNLCDVVRAAVTQATMPVDEETPLGRPDAISDARAAIYRHSYSWLLALCDQLDAQTQALAEAVDHIRRQHAQIKALGAECMQDIVPHDDTNRGMGEVHDDA
jgi:hypothetical protein